MTMPDLLKSRVAVITGAASGMGAASADLFAAEGASVVVLDLPKQRERHLQRVRDVDLPMRYVAADISRRDEVAAAVKDVMRNEGRIDILFNNAGFNLMKSIEDTTDEEFDTCFAVNVRGVFLACREVLPIMVRQGSGVILNTSSSAAVAGRGFLPVYSAAKGAILSLSKSLAVAYGPAGVRVNCIVPGSIETPMFASALGDDPEAARGRVREATPLRRIGEVDDIANAALFLCSENGAYLTGVPLPVDGGRTATLQEPQGAFRDTSSGRG